MVNPIYAALPTTIFTVMSGLAREHEAINLGQGFPDEPGPEPIRRKAAEEVLAALDVPYLAAHPVEFQTLDQWGGSERGLLPVESTIMVAIPELDGAAGPMVYGGRSDGAGAPCTGCDRGCTFARSERSHRPTRCVCKHSRITARNPCIDGAKFGGSSASPMSPGNASQQSGFE